jgi:hypothetical protein
MDQMIAASTGGTVAGSNAEMSSLTTHSGEPPPPNPSEKKSSGALRLLLWTLAIPVGLFLVLFLVELGKEIKNPTTVSERIESECQREFGSRGEYFVSDCRVRLGIEYLKDHEQDALDRAYNRSR